MTVSRPCLACPDCAAPVPLPENGPWLGEALTCAACGWQPPRQDGIPLLAPALAAAGSDYDPAGFDRLAAIEPWHFWFGPRAGLLAGLVRKHFPAARHFLEMGCGTGFVTRAVMARGGWTRVIGGEVAAEGLAHAARLLPPEVETLQLDGRAMPFHAAFDVIGCFDVLEHIDEQAEVLQGFVRALRPGGGVVLAVPQHRWLWSAADTHAQHKRRYARGELEARCGEAGLEVVASLSYAVATLPLMLVSRLIARGGDAREGAAVELRPPGLVNRLLRAALGAEARLSLAGLHWPIGGSRIIVARLPTTPPIRQEGMVS